MTITLTLPHHHHKTPIKLNTNIDGTTQITYKSNPNKQQHLPSPCQNNPATTKTLKSKQQLGTSHKPDQSRTHTKTLKNPPTNNYLKHNYHLTRHHTKSQNQALCHTISRDE